MNMRTKVIQKEIDNCIKSIVEEYAILDCDHYTVKWKMVSDDHRKALIALMVDLDDKEFLPFIDNEKRYIDDILYKLIGMIQNDDIDSDLDFAQSVKDAVNHYYNDKAYQLVSEYAAGVFTHSTLHKNDARLVRDMTHGDFIVQRI